MVYKKKCVSVEVVLMLNFTSNMWSNEIAVYPEAIERTKDLPGTQLYEAIHTLEDIQEEDA